MLMLPQRPGWPLLISPYRTLERPPEADLEAAGHMLAWMLFGWNSADWRRCILSGLAAFALYTSFAAHYLFELESVEDDWDRIVESEPDLSRQRETAGQR